MAKSCCPPPLREFKSNQLFSMAKIHAQPLLWWCVEELQLYEWNPCMDEWVRVDWLWLKHRRYYLRVGIVRP